MNGHAGPAPGMKEQLFENLQRGLAPGLFRVLEGDRDQFYVKALATGQSFCVRVEELED